VLPGTEKVGRWTSFLLLPEYFVVVLLLGLPRASVFPHLDISIEPGRDILLALYGDVVLQDLLEGVMNLGENRIEMRIARSAWFPPDFPFPYS
jgi:hypothetical protein